MFVRFGMSHFKNIHKTLIIKIRANLKFLNFETLFTSEKYSVFSIE